MSELFFFLFFFLSEFLNWNLSNDGPNHCPYSVFGWSRRLCEVRVHTPTVGLQAKPHLPWCFLTHWLVGWLVALKLTADDCSSPPPLDYLHSSPLCAACACYSKLSVLHTPAKMTCSVEFCWPPFDSEICFMSLNFCICNYFVHRTSEWFSFCFVSEEA